MKKITALLIALAMLFALAACSDDGAKTDGNGAEGDKKIKDEIVFAQSSDLTTLNPCIGTQERAYSLTNHMYDTLLAYDSEMNMYNQLATDYEWVDDLHLQMNLREGVKFHNGDEFTAQDVIFTFGQRADRGAAFTNYIESVEEIDKYTVVINFSSPHPSFLYQLTDPAFAMMPKDYFEADGADHFAAEPIGCGPYKMKDYVTGDYYTLERFDDYWGEPAKTQYLTMKIIPEAGQRTILLETGEIDVAYEIPYIDASKIIENDDLQFLSTPSMKIVMFYLNCESGTPMNNKLVRQAAEYAIDKAAIVEAVCYGYGSPAYAIVPDVVFEYKEVKEPHAFNLDKARELMEQAGCPDGFEMEIWTSSTQTNTEICQIVAEQLSAINIDAKIVVQDANTIDARQDAGDEFGMSLHFYSCNSGHAEYTLSNILPTGMLRNDSRYSSADYDEAYYAWLVTVEEKEREALLTSMYETQNEDTPVMPLYNEVKILGATKNLDGMQLSRIGAHEYQNAVVYED